MNKRKIIILVIVLILVLTLGIVIGIICSKNNKDKNDDLNINTELNSNQDDTNTSLNENNNSKEKILVAVFSRAGENYEVGVVDVGNTEIIANYIKDYTGADLFKIEPVVPYPKSYEETKEISTRERDNNERPKIKNSIENFDEYDTIFLGYPIWYGSYPMIINTFIESYDFSGKTIIPFNTHGGSGSSGTYEKLKEELSSSTFKEGLAIRGSDARSSKSTVEEWLRKIGY